VGLVGGGVGGVGDDLAVVVDADPVGGERGVAEVDRAAGELTFEESDRAACSSLWLRDQVFLNPG
jgi:hypothetical protein